MEQDPGNELLKAGEEKNVGIMARVPDASGVLTGKVNENTVFDKNITELAIKFILSHEQISIVLPTMISLEEIDKFSQISDGKYLDVDEMQQISEMYLNNFYVTPGRK